MGLIGVLKSFARVTRKAAAVSDAQIDTGGGRLITVQHFTPSGDDSQPLPSDYVVAVTVQQTGRHAAVGYIDPLNSQEAQAGEKRLYSRDGNGASAAVLWLKSDGTILATNAAGTLELGSNGTATINGATIDPSGNIVCSSISAPSVIANGKELADHTHDQPPDSLGDVQQPTGPNN